MNGAGNKILVLDLRGTRARLAPEDARALHRTPGLDYDQLMALGDPKTSGTAADVLIYNNDGTLAGACGNGTRCVADVLCRELGADAVKIETEAGIIACERLGPLTYRVDMGAPRLDWRSIPLSHAVPDTRRIELWPEGDAPAGLGPASAVSMGNPHAVFFVADLEAVDAARLGPLIEAHPIFPEKANVTFAKVNSRGDVTARVWERGVGLTLACGSAACATMVAAARLGLMERQGDGPPARGPTRHRVARLGRSRADDRSGRVRTRGHPRRRAVRPSRLVMEEAGETSVAAGSRRVDAIDCARGAALIGMGAYHFSWDLADFHLVSPMLPFTPPMRLLSHVVASAFLLAAGVSLALAHRKGFNAPAFWKRIAIVAGAAALVTAGSALFAPGQAIFFGILHCIVAASLIGALFLSAPAPVTLAAGALMILAPLFLHSTLFDPPWLMWLGLSDALPNTLDWRPLMPWAGVVLFGLGATRLRAMMARLTSPGRWRAASAPSRALCYAGRHSLPIYLIHQPILIGALAGLAALGLLEPKPDDRAFLGACEQGCVARGRGAEDCETSCRCVADAVNRSGEANRLGELDGTRRADLQRLADACMGR